MTVIYVDESGDLGWSFHAPYRQGGSSRHLTIAALLVSSEKKHVPKRLIKSLYKRVGASPGSEIKWVDLNDSDRVWLATQMVQQKSLLGQEMSLLSMTVKKEKVMQHIRDDPNKLYNYMMNLLLAKEMAKHPVVTLIPDQRSVKVASGNSMHDYLQTQLWFDLNAATQLTTQPLDSRNCAGLQYSDMLAGMVQSYFEDSKPACMNLLHANVQVRRLYF